MMRQRDGYLDGVRGASIYYQVWEPQIAPRALLLVVHGLAEHSGRYQRFAEHFVGEGYAVASFDHPGHGRSDGSPGFIPAFSDYVDNLDTMVGYFTGAMPGLPAVLLGHSMGGLTAATYLLQKQAAFAGCILSGPAVKTELEPPAWQFLLIRILSALLPRAGALQLDARGVSRDPEEVELYVNDPLVYSGKVSARLVLELFKTMEELRGRASDIRLPMLLLHGGADAMAAPSGSEFLFEHVSSEDKTLRIYPGLYHEIFNEPERAQVFADIRDWLDQRLSSGVNV
jgi:alpha-beta hydrolase superfamily lysophospholipase